MGRTAVNVTNTYRGRLALESRRMSAARDCPVYGRHRKVRPLVEIVLDALDADRLGRPAAPSLAHSRIRDSVRGDLLKAGRVAPPRRAPPSGSEGARARPSRLCEARNRAGSTAVRRLLEFTARTGTADRRRPASTRARHPRPPSPSPVAPFSAVSGTARGARRRGPRRGTPPPHPAPAHWRAHHRSGNRGEAVSASKADRGRPEGGAVEPAGMGGSAVGGARFNLLSRCAEGRGVGCGRERDRRDALLHIVCTSGARFTGLRLRGGTLIVKVSRGRRAKQIRVIDAEAFDPARSGLEI